MRVRWPCRTCQTRMRARHRRSSSPRSYLPIVLSLLLLSAAELQIKKIKGFFVYKSTFTHSTAYGGARATNNGTQNCAIPQLIMGKNALNASIWGSKRSTGEKYTHASRKTQSAPETNGQRFFFVAVIDRHTEGLRTLVFVFVRRMVAFHLRRTRTNSTTAVGSGELTREPNRQTELNEYNSGIAPEAGENLFRISFVFLHGYFSLIFANNTPRTNGAANNTRKTRLHKLFFSAPSVVVGGGGTR